MQTRSLVSSPYCWSGMLTGQVNKLFNPSLYESLDSNWHSLVGAHFCVLKNFYSLLEGHWVGGTCLSLETPCVLLTAWKNYFYGLEGPVRVRTRDLQKTSTHRYQLSYAMVINHIQNLDVFKFNLKRWWGVEGANHVIQPPILVTTIQNQRWSTGALNHKHDY